MKRSMLVVTSFAIALAVGGLTTVACKGGPELDDGSTTDEKNMVESLGEKKAAADDCATKGDDAGCPETGDAGE